MEHHHLQVFGTVILNHWVLQQAKSGSFLPDVLFVLQVIVTSFLMPVDFPHSCSHKSQQHIRNVWRLWLSAGCYKGGKGQFLMADPLIVAYKYMTTVCPIRSHIQSPSSPWCWIIMILSATNNSCWKGLVPHCSCYASLLKCEDELMLDEL